MQRDRVGIEILLDDVAKDAARYIEKREVMNMQGGGEKFQVPRLTVPAFNFPHLLSESRFLVGMPIYKDEDLPGNRLSISCSQAC